ncbi:MAG: response regulator transcription factor [Candidatus Limiplasma sp.]|nr:response regulator transcription factor [Candidatus Limiplasma sp.]
MIEDDVALCTAVRISLERAEYDVEICHDGIESMEMALSYAYDVLIVDRMLPDIDGLRVIASLRQKGLKTPVLILTALGSVSDRVAGLDAGADDYLVKPFAMDELLARLRALNRRPNVLTAEQEISWYDMTLNIQKRSLSGPAGERALSHRECKLLDTLFRSGGRTLSREVLFARIWGSDTEVEEGTLDSYIHYARRRMKAVGSGASLKTIYGVGYCLEAPLC